MRAYFFTSFGLLFLLSCATATQSTSYAGYGQDSVLPEILDKYAPKPIDPALQQKIESMLDIRSPGTGILSPDGKVMFFGWNVTGTYQVWKIEGPKSFPVQMTGGEDNTYIRGITPNGKFLILQRDNKGDEQPGLYLQSVVGGPLITVFKKKNIRAFHQFTCEDSSCLFYRANDIKVDSYAIYKYDLQEKKRELLFDQEGLWSIADHKKDGRLLLERAKGNLYSEFSEWSPETNALTPILGQDEMEEYTVRYGAREQEYIVLTNKFGNYRSLYQFQDTKFTSLTANEINVTSFYTDRIKEKILYMYNNKGYYQRGALNAKSFKPLKMPDFAKAVHTFWGNTTRDGRFTSMGIITEKSPYVSYIYDWKLGRSTQWVVPSAPEIETKHFAEATLEYYPARDGTQIPMFVRRPLGCQNRVCPVIVTFHGGPEGQSTPGFNIRSQMFIDEGFIYVSPNVRGSFGYGKSWLHADNGAKRKEIITDIADCAIYLRSAWSKEGQIPKIGIMGGSYGGYSALIGMTMFAGHYDAGMSIVGISNLYTFLMNTAPYRRILRITEYGDPEKEKEMLLALSPVSYVDRVKAPILIIQGATDPRVPAGEAIQIHEEMQKKGIESELIIYRDEGHGVRKRKNKVNYLGHTLGFFIQHLK